MKDRARRQDRPAYANGIRSGNTFGGLSLPVPFQSPVKRVHAFNAVAHARVLRGRIDPGQAARSFPAN